ncbi:MAG: class I SAM-dependent methyltransferase [Deltaproteobacteria bacterium]|nr:class I SAM-dependent methyltransferase [Deltaproteobacteria bacterium]
MLQRTMELAKIVLPNTREQEYEDRRRKRQMEVSLIIENLQRFLQASPSAKNRKLNILEFGSGDGFQIPYLKKIGNVIGSDIYTSDGVKKLPGAQFVECSIAETPFAAEQFDIIFSNHVIPDLDDALAAFREIRRIGKPNCLYAFSVPTALWLLLSLPAQYYNKARGMGRSFATDSKIMKLVRLALPEGRGCHASFIASYRSFTIKGWRRLFHENGFRVVEEKPLLLYGPSEWPVVPTSQSTTRVCSSMLFLLNKSGQ